MSDYIKREDAIAAVANYLGATSKTAALAAECILKPIPAAPVREVVRGRWELDTFETTATCSVCWCCIPIEWKYDDIRWDFCPNCGADMRTEEGEAT